MRDGSRQEITAQETADIVSLVNRLNYEAITVFRRLSPRVLIDLMKVACPQSAEFHVGLDPFAPAAFPVSWAGEHESPNWFDTARELTERWHHQQPEKYYAHLAPSSLASAVQLLTKRTIYYPI